MSIITKIPQFSDKRTGDSDGIGKDIRNEFQRDIDRIMFSSIFRRLQGKTQVFPLPGSVFVHNRLTHSLEVASVGGSLGKLVGEWIKNENIKEENEETKNKVEEQRIFYEHRLQYVIYAACLCHDIGNPPFGHSGEDAICTFFIKNENEIKKYLSEEEWKDLVNFEGNANTLRILTLDQVGKAKGGLKITYSTLAAIAKYPCESISIEKNKIHRKKFGFFQSEKQLFREIAKETNMQKESDTPLAYHRHPFVWLVEAADDICYHIIDLEDAHRLKIISSKECEDLLVGLTECIINNCDDLCKIKFYAKKIDDQNERISYYRAKAINLLISAVVEQYKKNYDSIMKGTLNISLFELVKNICPALKQIEDYSIKNIYNHSKVVELENAGYEVIYQLLNHFIFPVLNENKISKKDEKALALMPNQFDRRDDPSIYTKIMGVVDFISGMTDSYAVDLYRKIKGIEIGMKI